MNQQFYFDTASWLDFFENRDEPNFPKGAWTKNLIHKIIENNDKILLSDNNMIELNSLGYSEFAMQELLDLLKPNLICQDLFFA